MSNQEVLKNAGILEKNVKLTPEQEKAIESLTGDEMETLKSMKSIKERLGVEYPAILSTLIVHHIV